MEKIKILNKILFLVMIVLVSGLVSATIVPKGDSIEIRDNVTWDISEVDDYFVNQDPDPAEPGGYVEVRFKVENIGGDYAKDVMFELIPRYPFSLYDGTGAIRKVGDMHMQQTGEDAYILYYRLRVDKDAIEGNNMIYFRYSNDGGSTWMRKEYQIRVQTHDAILHVNSVKMMPEEIAPGGASDLVIVLENKADSLLKDIKVNLGVLTKDTTSTTITTTELPLTPLGSTNEKMIESIGGRESANVSFKLIADPDAESQVYKLPITLEYSDGLAKNYSETHYTSIIIGEKPDIIASIDSSEIISSKQAGTVTLKFTNKGASDIKFLYIELMQSSNYDIISPAEVYVGNIDSDDYETADFKIYVKKGRTVQLPLRLDYRDANNKVFKKDLILNLKLYSSSQAKKYGLIKVKSKMGSLIFFIVVLVGVWYYFKKKKNIDLFKILVGKTKIFVKKILEKRKK